MKNPIGQGHGQPGSFAGLSPPYSDEKSAQIAIVQIPFDKTTTYKSGTDKGPAAVIEASRNLELYDIETDFEVYLKGIHTDNPINANSSEEMVELGFLRVKKWLETGKFVVTLGGEHSISYGPIKAHAEKFGDLCILQFDAHADLQPAYENNPWSHASAMARVKEIPRVIKIVSCAIRSMSAEEKPFLDRDNTFFAHEMKEDTSKKILEKLSDNVYITFDLDAFDSSLMPSTGTPEPGGLFWNEAMKILKAVFETKNVVGFDVVELSPSKENIAPDYLAAKLVYKMLSYKFR